MGKGVSAQEKRDRMLAMFQNASAPFTKKDVEKHASKLFPSGAIEGVLKELRGAAECFETLDASFSGSLDARVGPECCSALGKRCSVFGLCRPVLRSEHGLNVI